MGNKNIGRRKTVDLTNQIFGRLTVIGELERLPSAPHKRQWLCRCECGAETAVQQRNLIAGVTKSCGCLRADLARLRFTTHGRASDRQPASVYNTWAELLQRCTNNRKRSYKDYGGRGIKVCERWLCFSNFLADMGERPSAKHQLDRKDNDGDYCPENCRWATQKQQSNNRRSNVWLTYQGERLTAQQLADKLGISGDMLRNRLRQGWSVEEAATRPKRGTRP